MSDQVLAASRDASVVDALLRWLMDRTGQVQRLPAGHCGAVGCDGTPTHD